MKRKVRLLLWTIGSLGAVLWTCFWIFGIVYTKNWRVIFFVGFGIFLAWEGFKTVREVKNSE